MIDGADARLPNDAESGIVLHTLGAVYSTMLLQVSMDYPGVPDVRTLTMSDLRFFYEGLRGSLKHRTKPKK